MTEGVTLAYRPDKGRRSGTPSAFGTSPCEGEGGEIRRVPPEQDVYSSIRLIGLTDWSGLRGANWSPVGSAQQNQSSVRPGL